MTLCDETTVCGKVIRTYYEYWLEYTVKKKGTFWNLKKRFGGLQKVCKCIESSKKRIKKNSEPLKDLTVCPGEDPFFFETFLSSVDQKKGFVGKNETYKVSYWTSRFRTGFPIKPLY